MVTSEQAYKYGFEMGSEAVYQVIHRIKKENQYEHYITIAAKEYVDHHWYRFDYFIEGAYNDDDLVSQLWEKYYEGAYDGIEHAVKEVLTDEDG